MKYVISFLLLFCVPFLAFSQTRVLEKAVKHGKDPRNSTYFVEFDKHYDMRDVDNWFRKNGYTLVQGKTIDFPVFGDTKVGYRQIHFMTTQDYAVVQEKARRLAQEQSRNSSSNSSSISTGDVLAVLFGAAVLYGGYKAVESGLSNLGTSGSSSSSYSSGSSGSSSSKSTTASTPCYTITAKKTCGWSSDQCYETVYYDNTKKVECPVSILKCSNGTSKEIYYLPIDAGMFTPKGYYKNISGPDERIGDNLQEAIKTVCGCN